MPFKALPGLAEPTEGGRVLLLESWGFAWVPIEVKTSQV